MQIDVVKSKFLGGSFDQNTYCVSSDDEVIIIDAGAEIEDIKQVVGNKKVLAILFTHLHFDHTWNVENYIKQFNVDVYINSGAQSIFGDYNENASTIIGQKITHKIPEKNIKYYAKKLKIGSFDIQVYDTPGHTRDGVCLQIQRCLWTGDTVFADGVGRTDLVGGNPKELESSLQTILNIDFDTAFPGHFEQCSKAHLERTIKYYL